jgi:hypothetical protein
VLSNSKSSFNGSVAIVNGKNSEQVAELEQTETFLLWGRAAEKRRSENLSVFFLLFQVQHGHP